MFSLQFPVEEIPALAERFSYDNDESKAAAAGRDARARGHYSRRGFLDVCAWKSPRSKPLVAQNDAAAIEAATHAAFGEQDEAKRMDALLRLDGVGIPTASALLFFFSPDEYPILDYRALESLGVKGRSVYAVSFWLRYLQACRTLARTHRVSVRTLDKALWQYSKETNSTR